MWQAWMWKKKDDISAVLILESYIRKKKKEN
jgi:RNase H-fold protein (predicted Holliday junction resolvase)